MSDATRRMRAWNEGDDGIPDGYATDSLDWQKDMRAILDRLKAAELVVEGARKVLELPRERMGPAAPWVFLAGAVGVWDAIDQPKKGTEG